MDTSEAANPLEAPVSAEKPASRRGFACLDPALVRELARRGGQSAHRRGVAHEFSSEEARAAGRKGGLAVHHKRQAVAER